MDQYLPLIYTAIGTGVAGIIAALVALIKAFLDKKTADLRYESQQRDIEILKQVLSSTDTDYSTTCPYCGQEIVLNNLSIIAKKHT